MKKFRDLSSDQKTSFILMVISVVIAIAMFVVASICVPQKGIFNSVVVGMGSGIAFYCSLSVALMDKYHKEPEIKVKDEV